MSRSLGFSTRSDTNQAVQSKKMTRCLKFGIKKVEGSYYICSENKGADQLRGYREADLRLCFRICKKPVFSRRGSYSGGQITVIFLAIKPTPVSGIVPKGKKYVFFLIEANKFPK